MFFQKRDKFKSALFDENSFYDQFMKDLQNCKGEVIIESPYITSSRMEFLYPLFNKLLSRNIYINIITKDPSEHDKVIRYQSTNEILTCTELGINTVLLKGNFHRKLIIIDRTILWEGSLNVLSYNHSQEMMRRIESKDWSNQMINFLQLKKYLKG